MIDRPSRISLMLAALVLVGGLNVYSISRAQDEASRWKYQAAVANATVAAYKDEALKQHVQYEGARDMLAKQQHEIDALKQQLDAQKERVRVAERASRSRRIASPPPAVSGGVVHDVTMYCPTGNTTASGKWPTRGMVATISRTIPFGTRVQIEGLGTYVVEDRIGHGSEFDIFTPSCAEADRFGRQHLRVTIL